MAKINICIKIDRNNGNQYVILVDSNYGNQYVIVIDRNNGILYVNFNRLQ